MIFYKYHGTGNDFILIDNRDGGCSLTTQQIAHLCHRHYGIGADGLMLLDETAGFDFKMVYYNADGGESTMCGNGGRCIVAFARMLGIITTTASFLAIDGPHKAMIAADGTVSLHMKPVADINIKEGYTVLDTGSPHYVAWVKDVNEVDVYTAGRDIRYSADFNPGGINVNFAHLIAGQLSVRTYERGVEDETMSCGTGVTAVAIAATCSSTGIFTTSVATPGGMLTVSFTKDTAHSATDVILTGPAVFVFKGELDAG